MMKPKLLIVGAILVLESVLGFAFQIASTLKLSLAQKQFGALWSVQNDRCIFLQKRMENVDASIINLLDFQGKLLLTLDPLSQIEGATDLSIYDVSCGKSGLVAVSAVARQGDARPVALLLAYSQSGTLLNAQRLDSEMEVTKLRVDVDDSIWGIGNGTGDKTPEAVPMFYRFTESGRRFEGLFRRSDFGQNQEKTKNLVRESGTLHFGITHDKVWCWFPASRELVTFDKLRRTIQKLHTGLPTTSQKNLDVTELYSAVLTASGSFLSSVGFVDKSRSQALMSFFRWNTLTGWEKLTENEPPARHFVGVSGDLPIVASLGEDRLIWGLK